MAGAGGGSGPVGRGGQAAGPRGAASRPCAADVALRAAPCRGCVSSAMSVVFKAPESGADKRRVAGEGGSRAAGLALSAPHTAMAPSPARQNTPCISPPHLVWGGKGLVSEGGDGERRPEGP